MKIIPARPDDIPVLIEIQDECRLSAWTEEGYRLEMERPDSIIWLAQGADEAIAGFIVGRAPTAIDREMFEAEIFNIGTRPACRQQGIGSLLLDAFVRESSDRGTAKIWLEVRESNETAQAFYASRGFETVSTRPGFYSDPVENAKIMALPLRHPTDLTKT